MLVLSRGYTALFSFVNDAQLSSLFFFKSLNQKVIQNPKISNWYDDERRQDELVVYFKDVWRIVCRIW